MIHERDRQTDGQTDSQTPHADIGRAPLMHCIARQKRGYFRYVIFLGIFFETVHFSIDALLSHYRPIIHAMLRK